MDRCLNCFKEYDASYGVCPHCGTPNITRPTNPIDLMPGIVLGGRYLIGLRIGAGGFGIVYNGYDLKLGGDPIAIKECYISRLCTRSYGNSDVILPSSEECRDEFDYRKRRFLAEARCMKKMGKHPCFVNVYDQFEENNTAYFVMERLAGHDLKKELKLKHRLPIEQVRKISVAVGEALKSLHELGIYHRDVAPDNIWLGTDGSIKLIDLGGAKLPAGEEDVIDAIEKTGYTPPEQYLLMVGEEAVGPFLDVYALGATMYKMLTGETPPESTNRKVSDDLVEPRELNPDIPIALNDMIVRSMAVDYHLRYQTMDEVLKLIGGEKKVVSLKKEKSRRKNRRVFSIVATLVLIGAISLLVYQRYRNKELEALLDPATIHMWHYEDVEGERNAVRAIAEDFENSFKGVKVQVRSFDDKEKYLEALEKAAKKGELPDLFESTDASDFVMKKAISVKKVYNSDLAKKCLFLSQVDVNQKKIPLGFVVPVACVVTKGNCYIDFPDYTFASLSDFDNKLFIHKENQEGKTPIAVQKGIAESLTAGLSEQFDYSKFITMSQNIPVCVISSMDIRQTENYVRTANEDNISDCVFVYSDMAGMEGRFTEEWSLGAGEKAQKAAAERLLEWMLGYKYQNIFMKGGYIEDGNVPIPVNEQLLMEKCNSRNQYYKGLKEIYKELEILGD